MKNKKLTYFLIVVVATLWGFIIYRVFDVAGGNDDEPVAAVVKPEKEPLNDYTVKKDTSHLLLNYPDPFGVSPKKDTTAKLKPAAVALSHKIIPIVPKPAMSWSFITYSGYIRNPESKKLVALVSINGQNLTLTEGETKSQVKLLKNLRDSIKVSYAGKTKFIVIKTATL